MDRGNFARFGTRHGNIPFEYQSQVSELRRCLGNAKAPAKWICQIETKHTRPTKDTHYHGE
eukprot:scaffold45845_cov168-Amphora_coffeaeformis.AAC.1